MNQLKTFILVSKCVEVTTTTETPLAEFHFKGTIEGTAIKSVNLDFDPDKFEVKEGIKYVVHAALETVNDGHIFGKILKLKEVENEN